jgi:hypothetical protein
VSAATQWRAVAIADAGGSVVLRRRARLRPAPEFRHVERTVDVGDAGRADVVGEAIRNFSTVDLGALFFDAEACYTGGVQTADLKRARGRMALLVTATSVHKHGVVRAALYEATDDPSALDALLERARAWRNAWWREG